MAQTQSDATTDASECPNCHTDSDDEGDCPHLLAGDDCPNCGAEMEKPRYMKVNCPNCEWVVNGRYQDVELRQFNLTFRQARRLLQLCGYIRPGTPESAGTALRELCIDHGIEPDDLNDVLDDLRGSGVYGD